MLYLLFLLPQLVHNLRSNNLEKLSFGMHTVLFCAYCADLIYGFGKNLPWQYKTVTIVGLLCLVIQHWQITSLKITNQSSSHSKTSKTFFLVVSFLLFTFLGGAVYLIFHNTLSPLWVDLLGWISQLGWLTYAIPQIYKNFRLSSHQALSQWFVILLVLMTFCDSISAWCLDWGWPNKIGSPLSLLIKLLLLYQFMLFKSQSPTSICKQ